MAALEAVPLARQASAVPEVTADDRRAQAAQAPCPAAHQQELAAPEMYLHRAVPKGSAAPVTSTQNQSHLT